MNAHDLTMLGDGINIGVLIAVAVYFIGEHIDDRRDRKLIEETRAKLNLDREVQP